MKGRYKAKMHEDQKIPNPLTQEFIETCRKESVPETWKIKMRNTLSKTCNYSTQIIRRMLPVINVIRHYKIKSFLVNDVIGGLTVTFMQLPQGMAYAVVADLPIEVGLFMGFFPVICYFILGSSKHLSFGAVVVISLMYGSLMEKRFPSPDILQIANLNEAFSDKLIPNETTIVLEELFAREKIKFAAAITMITGITQLIMAILRLGFVIKFLSNAIISAFSAGVAFHVGISQLKNVLGISVSRYSGFLSFPRTLYAICLQLPNSHYPEIILSLVTIFIICTIKCQINERFKDRIRIPVPIDLIMVILMTPISNVLQLEEKYNFKVVGHIPRGLPAPFVPDISYAKDNISDGISIGIIAFAYSISVALFVSRKEGYEIDANQELFAYGITNTVISFFGCFTASGAVSRTTVQVGCGAKSQICSLIAAMFLLIIIFVAGPWLKTLPTCILSCIILVSLRSMFKELFTLPKLWKICKYDGLIWIATFAALILTTVGVGLLIGVIIGVCSVIMRTLWVKGISLGVISNTKVFLDKDKYQGVTIPDRITVISFSSPLYYANVENFRNEIDSKTVKLKKTNNSNGQLVLTDFSIIINPKSVNSVQEEKSNHKVIIECSGITFIDGMGAAALQQLYVDYKKNEISCFFSGVNEKVISVLKSSGAFKMLQHVIYLNTYDAMLATDCEKEEISTRF